MWDTKSFKDANNFTDVTPFLNGATNIESLELSNVDLQVANFSDMYFVEIISSDGGDNPAVASVVNLRLFYATIVALLYTVDASCLNCNTNLQSATLIDLYLENIRMANQVGRFRDAITFFNKMNIICAKTDCKDCYNQTVQDPGSGWVSVGVLDCILDLD